MNRPWKVILAFVAVFVAGLLCGDPLMRQVRDYRQDNRPVFAERTMHRYQKELGLTPEQAEKIKPILERAQEEWRRLRQDNVRNLTAAVDRMHAEVAAELNPDQREKLEHMRKELRTRAEHLRGRVRGRESEHTRAPKN